MTTSRPFATAVLLSLAALVYSAWVMEVVLPTALHPARTYVSELAATDQPYTTLFRTADLVAGALAAAAATLLSVPTRTRMRTRTRPRRGPVARTGAAALLLFGVATAVDSRLPLSCTPTDPECATRETAGLVPWTHDAHTVSSTIALCAILVAMATLTRTVRHGPALLALELAATAWTLAAIAALETGHDGWGLGIAQRLQVGVIAIWLGVLAVSLLRAPTHDAPLPAHRPLREADVRP
ncbi:DUF998 domain-containing protein [Streptomyces tauricus]|uniref:DUF998 domain-containing protein n=1 Tax=Streptomyces tauricus TaxID=68274 RepID=UPI0022441F5B|nr:DUF998 domain-containing protein [Streptomyces tauricus]MCW8101312.1 DUF998 domain-containing protein [Streptomyces tauricus]